MRRISTILILLALTSLLALSAPAADSAGQGTWTGEVIDVACYLAKGAHGGDHAGCAKGCVKGGQPMGLLTDDGQVFLLAADHGDDTPFEALKDLAGEKAEVSGTLAEKDGMKMISVEASKPVH